MPPASSSPPAGLVKLDEIILGADQATMDFLGIPQDFAHLMLVLNVRATGAVTSAIAEGRFNNDSGANYDYQYVIGGNTTASAANGMAQAFASLGDCPGASATAGYAATIDALISNYAGTTFNKTLVARSAVVWGTAATNINAQMIASHWRSAAAINRITLLPSSGSWKAGSRATIYGMP